MHTTGLTGSLAAWSAGHRWWVIGAWIAAIVLLGLIVSTREPVFTSRMQLTNFPESQRALRAVEELRGAEPLIEMIVVSHPTLTVEDEQFRAFVAGLVEALRSEPEALNGEQTTSYFEMVAAGSPFAEGLVSQDRSIALVRTMIRGELDSSADSVAVLNRVIEETREGSGFAVLAGGFATAVAAFEVAAFEDLASEQYVLPIAPLILVAVFGAVVAALVPMVLAVVTMAATFITIAIVASFWPLDTFVFNITLMIGLAVSIDYALFVVGRFREELAAGHEVNVAIAIAGDTASRAVLFSGATVVIGLLGMFIIPNTVFRSFATGANIVVTFSVLVSLTLLPASLSLLGESVNRLRVPFFASSGRAGGDRGFWAGVTRAVMARPWVSVIGSTALLVMLALPYTQIELGFSGPEVLPEKYEARQAFDLLDSEFVGGAVTPTLVVVLADDVTSGPVGAAIEALVAELQADPELTVLGAPDVSPAGDWAIIEFAVPGETSSDQAFDAFRRVRDVVVPAHFDGTGAEVLIGGETALTSDFVDSLGFYTPVVFAFVLGLSFILLLLVFRSIVVPLKAIAMNLLSVGAAYGVVVAVFQLGWGADFLGFSTVEKLEGWLPLFLFTILFGLSMDYHVFLLTRIRENYDRTGNNAQSVEIGLRSTAKIITGAALIMVAVFGGFALGELVMFQQMGLGLAVAIFLDATLVRTILVPAAMELLGDWNWYLPSWLRWLPDLRVEAGPRAPVAETTQAAGGGSEGASS